MIELFLLAEFSVTRGAEAPPRKLGDNGVLSGTSPINGNTKRTQNFLLVLPAGLSGLPFISVYKDTNSKRRFSGHQVAGASRLF